MKKVSLFILLCFALVTSCSDFLKEEDKDKVIPRTVDHFLQIMHREAFITNKMNYRTEFMTDDIEESFCPHFSSQSIPHGKSTPILISFS